MFSQVSVCPQGGRICLWSQGGLPHTHTPRRTDTTQADTPWSDTPRQTHTPRADPLTQADTHTSWADTPIECWDTPPPSACWDTHPPAQCMLGYCQQAGGTHPTGMHSCFKSRHDLYNIQMFVVRNTLYIFSSYRTLLNLAYWERCLTLAELFVITDQAVYNINKALFRSITVIVMHVLGIVP